jgi:hypothetical protein
LILVTGTWRSGTSLWMQILIAAGFSHVGQAFPGEWETTLADANPRGFYESMLRDGVYYQTNPHPRTGAYLHPALTRDLAVKVFIPGLIRSDVAFLDRVVATIRPWREHVQSVRRLLKASPNTRSPGAHGDLPVEVDWWYCYHSLFHDVATRRYPCLVACYPDLLADPEAVVGRILAFLGRGDLCAAVSVVDPALYRERNTVDPLDIVLEPADIAVFDALYETIRLHRPFDRSFRTAMDATKARLQARFPLA